MAAEGSRIDFMFLGPPLPGRWIRYGWNQADRLQTVLILLLQRGTVAAQRLIKEARRKVHTHHQATVHVRSN